jgi:POT family proton-dependent oligopeptide transporter
VSALHERRWLGQPPGLTILFLTNMWEQFSYYGMRALLVYYMTKQLAFSQGASSFVYGAYAAGAYFTPLIGGIIADRWLGNKRAVIIGSVIMSVGHFMMAFPPLLFPALATIALGNGLFLPTLPAQVNDLYAADDPRRGWAYNVYYVGINIGGFLAPLVCGTLGELYGWHYGFNAAGIGMLLGLIIYLAGGRYLPPEAPRSAGAASGPRPRPGQRRRLYLLLFAVAASVTIFRAAYEQVGNTVALWADSGIDRHVGGGWSIPMTWFQSLNPLMVMLFTPPLLAWWRRRAERGHDQSPARRMAMGAAIVAGAYLLLAGVEVAASGHVASWVWLVLFFTIFTLGELFILPTGLGLFARLAPANFEATTVAAWFLAIFSGSLAAGLTGMLWSVVPHAVFFALLAALALVASVLLRLLDASVMKVEETARQPIPVI